MKELQRDNFVAPSPQTEPVGDFPKGAGILHTDLHRLLAAGF